MVTITDRIWNVTRRLDTISAGDFVLERAKLLQRLREASILLEKGWPGSQEIETIIQHYGSVHNASCCPTPGVEWVKEDWPEGRQELDTAWRPTMGLGPR